LKENGGDEPRRSLTICSVVYSVACDRPFRRSFDADDSNVLLGQPGQQIFGFEILQDLGSGLLGRDLIVAQHDLR